jgi:hypothetical protein
LHQWAHSLSYLTFGEREAESKSILHLNLFEAVVLKMIFDGIIRYCGLIIKSFLAYQLLFIYLFVLVYFNLNSVKLARWNLSKNSWVLIISNSRSNQVIRPLQSRSLKLSKTYLSFNRSLAFLNLLKRLAWWLVLADIHLLLPVNLFFHFNMIDGIWFF